MPTRRWLWSLRVAQVCLIAVAATMLTVGEPATAVAPRWSILDNGSVQIGVDVNHGAAIGIFARSSDGHNFLNSTDAGRYMQQSYYGNPNGGVWNGMPWVFNPVQGGDAFHNPSQLLEFSNNSTTIYAKTRPKDWALNNVDTPSLMEEWITLRGDVAHVRFRFTYTGTETHNVRDQEVPAFFVQPQTKHLVYYGGSSPWTGSPVTKVIPPTLGQQPQMYFTPTEGWAAYVNDAGYGIGLYHPGVRKGTAYFCGNCSYFALLDVFGISQGFVYDYNAYLKIGTVAQIRDTFNNIRLGRSDDLYDPIGTVEALTSPAKGKMSLWGWTVDRDVPKTAIKVHVYVTHPNGHRSGPLVLLADQNRPDVGQAYPAFGPYHGYSRDWTGLSPGVHTVDVYAIDASNKPDDYTTLGRKSIRVS